MPQAVNAQFGPIQTRGYLEYKFDHTAVERGTEAQSHAVALRTDFSTYFWRPWLAQLSGTLVATESRTGYLDRTDQTSLLQGGLRAFLMPRSRYPLSVFYENFFDESVNAEIRSDAKRQSMGLLQQLNTRRLGTYSLEFRRSSIDRLRADGYFTPLDSVTNLWQLNGRKTFGKNTLNIMSSSLEIDSTIPQSYRDIVRHSIRHSWRIGQMISVQNTLFLTDEQNQFESRNTLREFNQFSSIATWRPRTSRRLLLSGRGLFQDTATNGDSPLLEQDRAFLSVSANYELTDHVSLFGNVGYSNRSDTVTGKSDSLYQQLGSTYTSDLIELGEGKYNYSGRLFAGNRSDDTALVSTEVQGINAELAHGYVRALTAFGGRRFDLRLTQQVVTTRDTADQERNSLRHAAHLASSGEWGSTTHYFRAGIIDQRDSGNEKRLYQLGDVSYSVQGNIDRYRSWNVNLMAQFGRREQDEPIMMAGRSRSSSYRVDMYYRHAELFEVPFLDFTSDLRFQSDDFRSDDPFELYPAIEQERIGSTWRNQLDYRLGLLQMRAKMDVYDSNGQWRTAFSFTVRRYFGFD